MVFSILILLFACPTLLEYGLISVQQGEILYRRNTKVYLHWSSAKKYLDFTIFQVIGIQCPYHCNKGFSKFDTSYHCKSDLIIKTSNSVKCTQAGVLYLVQLKSKTKSSQQIKSLLDSQAKHFLKYDLSIKNNYSIWSSKSTSWYIPKRMKAVSKRHVYIPVLSTLCTIAKGRSNPSVPLMNG